MFFNIQVILRGSFEHIDATPENNYKLINSFKDNSLSVIPTTFQQIKPSDGAKLFNRMGFVEQTGEEIIIEIGMDQVKITQNSMKEMQSQHLDEFIVIVNKILSVFDNTDIEFGNYSRVSLVVNKLNNNSLSEMKNLYNKFDKFNDEFDSLSEWKYKVAKQNDMEFNSKKDIVNVVKELGRAKGEVAKDGDVKEFDNIWIAVDINTLDEIRTNRFDTPDSIEFIVNATSVYKNELKIIEDIIYERA